MLLVAIKDQVLSDLYRGIMKLCINPKALTQEDTTEITTSNYVFPRFYQQKALQHIFSCILTFHELSHEQNLIQYIRIYDSDLFVVHYLDKLLQDMKDNEQAVLMIVKTFLVPIILAIHPENHAVNPKQFLKILIQLNPIAYSYRFAQILQKYTATNFAIRHVASQLSTHIKELQDAIEDEEARQQEDSEQE